VKSFVIGDAAGRGEAAYDALVREMAAAAPAVFQVREKKEADRALYERVRRTRAALPSATRVLVNGRPDIAVAAGADGVQLPADGLPAADVRRAFPRPFLVGVSCHSLEDVARAAEDGADFALLAPIYGVPGKGVPLGSEILDALEAPLPIWVLGGMTVDRAAAWPAARRARVAGVAGIGLFYERGEAAVRALAALDEPPPGSGAA
jgi:thiamine-phosphate pyrophosphorylase